MTSPDEAWPEGATPQLGPDGGLEAQFDQWRGYLRRRKELTPSDVEELEDHLRGSMSTLTDLGLRPDEAFLVAVKRMGSLDELTREFAREHSHRLWKQLVLAGELGSPASTEARRSRRDLLAMLICAAAAVVSVKAPELFGLGPIFDIPSAVSDTEPESWFWIPNFSLFALPWLAAFLAWRRRARPALIAVTVALFVLGAVAANVFPLASGSQSLALTGIHLPIALWFAVGVAYVADNWRSSRRRMDFVRFTGEWLIYFTLIALGGGVLIAFVYGIFTAIHVSPDVFVLQWLLPCGIVAAVVVAGWLVEAKQSLLESIAPILTKLFTPLFTAVLLAFLVAYGVTGRGLAIDRDALILFDLLLVVVLGLLLYSVSSREPLAPAGPFDRLQLGLVVSALLVDAIVLYQISGRIFDYGATPNKTVALGLNAILLVNLVWSARLMVGLIARQRPFVSLERWQTSYLPVYALWAWIVVLVFPPVFSYV